MMRGVGSVKSLVRTAKAKGYDRLALTDRDNLYGLWFFLRACSREGVRPITGAEVTQPGNGRRAICLVESEAGFKNLCRLLTRRHTEEGFSLEEAMLDHGRGLTVLTDSPGLLTSWREAGLGPWAMLAVKPHGLGIKLRKICRKADLRSVACPDSYFLDPAGFEVHRTLRAIDNNTSLSRLEPTELAPEDAYLAAPREYQARFLPWPEAVRATRELAERLEFIPRPGVIMPPWEDGPGRTAPAVLREEAYRGARVRYGEPLPPAVVERLEYELKLIGEKNFCSYFLVVRDIVRRSPRICGRGSGAASIVAYSLGITNVCPIKFNLYFERFINPARLDPPDIDVDFAWDERDGVIDSVLEQYRGRAAMVATHIGFRGKMAIREVAKVWGIPEREIKATMKRFPWLKAPRETETGLQAKTEALPDGRVGPLPEPWPEILSLAQQLIKAPRHISVHVGGVVITPGPIRDYAPLEIAPKGVPIIQWEIDGAEAAGLVKIDLLGNRSLGVIRDAIGLVRESGREFDETRWEPEDDPLTRKLVAKGRTMGCFYIESPATRLLQQKARKGDYEHLVIHSSIIRPAANDWIQEYLRRLRGGAWEPIHPLLEDVLAETYGIMVYQEHVSQAAVAVAGFSHSEADRLRKVMTKKDRELEVADYKEKFFTGAREQGLTGDQIRVIWSMMLSFSGYSFCKPHSASYARVSFQAAFLKAHFPAEFMAAVISNQGGFYSPFAYLSEARRLGVQILPPDINRSRVKWNGERGRLRVGLMAVKGLGTATRERIVSEREKRPFGGFDDFMDRARPEEDEARGLILAGGLDSIAGGRARAGLLWLLARRKKARPPIKNSLFPAEKRIEPPDLPPDDERERLRREFRCLGLLTDRHPITLFGPALKGQKINGDRLVKAIDLPDMVGRKVSVAGWLITAKTVRSKHDQPMQFTTFEDETGLIETTIFPKPFKRYHLSLEWGRPYLLSGLVEENFGAVTLTVAEIRKL